MNDRFVYVATLLCALLGIGGCATSSPRIQKNAALLPPQHNINDYALSEHHLNAIEASSGGDMALSGAPKKCSFSSFHRKNALGYEFDDARQLSLKISPDIDVFDMSVSDVEIGLNFTMALGGKANKRPKCTYGSGYYGWLPYAVNNDVELGGITDMKNIKSFTKEKIREREERRQKRERKKL